MDERPSKPKLRKSGKVRTLLDHELAHREQVRTFEEEVETEIGAGQAGSRISLKFLVPAALIGIAAVAVVVAFSVRGDSGEGSAVPNRTPQAEIDEGAVSALRAGEVARRFLKAETEEERMALVRNAETLDLASRRYPAEVMAYPVDYRVFDSMPPANASGEMRMQRFAVTLADGARRLICVAETPTGLRVDYDAFARHSTALWEELMMGRAGEEMRVVVKRSTYFNRQFTDDEWTAFQVSSPDWPDSVTGYARKGSATEGVLTAVTKRVRRQRVTLELRPLGDSYRHKQFVIEKVLARGWVLTPGDIEAKWILEERKRGGLAPRGDTENSGR